MALFKQYFSTYLGLVRNKDENIGPVLGKRMYFHDKETISVYHSKFYGSRRPLVLRRGACGSDKAVQGKAVLMDEFWCPCLLSFLSLGGRV